MRSSRPCSGYWRIRPRSWWGCLRYRHPAYRRAGQAAGAGPPDCPESERDLPGGGRPEDCGSGHGQGLPVCQNHVCKRVRHQSIQLSAIGCGCIEKKLYICLTRLEEGKTGTIRGAAIQDKKRRKAGSIKEVFMQDTVCPLNGAAPFFFCYAANLKSCGFFRTFHGGKDFFFGRNICRFHAENEIFPFADRILCLVIWRS